MGWVWGAGQKGRMESNQRAPRMGELNPCANGDPGNGRIGSRNLNVSAKCIDRCVVCTREGSHFVILRIEKYRFCLCVAFEENE